MDIVYLNLKKIRFHIFKKKHLSEKFWDISIYWNSYIQFNSLYTGWLNTTQNSLIIAINYKLFVLFYWSKVNVAVSIRHKRETGKFPINLKKNAEDLNNIRISFHLHQKITSLDSFAQSLVAFPPWFTNRVTQ